MNKGILWVAAVTGFIVTAISGVSPLRAEMNLSEGRWETIMEMTMEGMPFKLPTTVATQCITRENAVPKGSDKQSNCKVLSQNITGNTVTWKVRCVEKDMINEGEGEVTYSGGSYSGKMFMTMTGKKGATKNMNIKMSGRRVGDCTEQDRKDRDKLKAQIDQAKAGQEDYEAKISRAEEIAKLTVPEDGPGACLLSDPACEGKSGTLNLQDGQWEITEEGTTATKDTSATKATKGKSSARDGQKMVYAPANTQTTTRCLLNQDALSYSQEQNCVKEKKRGGDRITWNYTCGHPGATIEEKGGIVYNGNTYSGVKIVKTNSQGTEITSHTRLSGRRMGDGNCLALHMDTSTKRKGNAESSKPAEAEPDNTQNPVRTFKKIFGF